MTNADCLVKCRFCHQMFVFNRGEELQICPAAKGRRDPIGDIRRCGGKLVVISEMEGRR